MFKMTYLEMDGYPFKPQVGSLSREIGSLIPKEFRAQPVFTWSKLKIETLEKGVKYVQS